MVKEHDFVGFLAVPIAAMSGDNKCIEVCRSLWGCLSWCIYLCLCMYVCMYTGYVCACCVVDYLESKLDRLPHASSLL